MGSIMLNFKLNHSTNVSNIDAKILPTANQIFSNYVLSYTKCKI